jgi:hypothetical protein
MHWEGYEPKNPVFLQAKAVRNSDRVASVIGSYANSTKLFVLLRERASQCGALLCIFYIFFNATSISFTSYIYLWTFLVFVKKMRHSLKYQN